jgi:UDP-glucose 4-epimerase
MRILITGGAGFIGSHTAVELIQGGHTPIILDNFCNSNISSLAGIEAITGIKPKLHTGDCTDAAFITSVFEQEKIDGIIHFAALKAVGESIEKPLLYYRNNLDSLIILLEHALLFEVPSFVFSSSATVYGEPDALPILETALVKNATSPYGNTKRIGENIVCDAVRASCGKLSAVALRYFNPIGAHPSGLIGELPLGVPNNLVPFVTQTAIGIREKLTVFGNDYPTPDGSCIRDYIHVADLAEAHIQTLQFLSASHHKPFDVFNVGTGKGVSVKELLVSFEAINEVKVPFVIGKRRKGDSPVLFADVHKITTTLNWKAKHSLEEALRDAWRWQQNLTKK